jgi:Arc/MetJ family transcription regulator
MRTNIEIPDDIMEQAFLVSQLKTKREIVEAALFEFVQNHSRKNIADLRGQIKFADGYDYKKSREGHSHDPC